MFELWWEQGENKQKEAGSGQLKKNIICTN